MNHIKLLLGNQSDDPDGFQPIDILIDGINLVDMLKKIEFPFAEQAGTSKIAGAYCGLPRGKAKMLLGQTAAVRSDLRTTLLMCCECGESGCWDFVCKITLTESTVTWSDFKQVHRDWDYTALGSFIFDR